ncbi:MAG: hypothetical protein WDW38_003863 [Sanguina aurantia]
MEPLFGTGQNLQDASAALANFEANTGYTDWLRLRGTVDTIGTLAIDSFASIIAPVVNIFAAELNLAANVIVTVSGSILVSGNVISIFAAVLTAQSDAYTAMLAAAAVTSTVTATTPAIASRSAALPPATQKTHVRSKLGNLKLLKPLQMAYAQ